MHTYNIRCSDMILWSFQTENCECIKFLQHQTNPKYINPHRMKILQWYLEVKWLVKQSASCCKFSFLSLDMIKLFCFTRVMQDLYKPKRMLFIETTTFLFELQKLLSEKCFEFSDVSLRRVNLHPKYEIKRNMIELKYLKGYVN